MTTTSLLFSRLRDLKPSKTETQPQWPDPEASIGTWYRSLGRQECWELCGPGRVSYLSLAAEIRDHLEKHGDVVRATVIWSAYMVGKSKAVANPMVFFCSSSVEARSTVRKEVKSSGVLSRYPCFRTAESSRPPHLENLRQLTLSDRDIVFRERTQRSIARCNNPTGRVITTQTSDSDAEYKCATVGAVLEAEEVLYFTTVAHAFDNKDVWRMEEDAEFEFDLDEDHSDDCYGSSAATVLLSAKMPPPRLESSREPGAPRPTVDAAHGVFHASEIVHRGSGADELLDYCLLPLDKEDGRIFKGAGVLDTRCKFHSVHPKGMLYHPEDCRVIVYTQQASEGILSETPTFLTAASGTSQEYWTISFAGDLMAGDCGAIAVDTRGMLVGHIVAGDPTSKTALLVPGHQMLQHARNTFAPSIALAQALKRCKPVNAPSQADMAAIAREMVPHFLLLNKKRKMKLAVARRTIGGTLILRNFPSEPLPIEPRSLNAKIFQERLNRTLEDMLDGDRNDFNLEAVPLPRIRRRARISWEQSKQTDPATGRNALGSDLEGSEEDWFIHKLLEWFFEHPTTRSEAPLCARCNQPAQLEALRNENSNADFKSRKNHRSVRIHCVNEDCTAFPKERLVPTRWAMPLAMSRLLAICTTLCGLRSRVLWIPPQPIANVLGGFWLELYSKHQDRWVVFDLKTGVLGSWRAFSEFLLDRGLERHAPCCIALSPLGPTDVTKLYNPGSFRCARYGFCSSGELLYILRSIRMKMRTSLPRDKILECEKEEAEEEAEQSQLQVEVLCEKICKAASRNGIGDSWGHGAADDSIDGPADSRIRLYGIEYPYSDQDFDEESETPDGSECYGRISLGRELDPPAPPHLDGQRSFRDFRRARLQYRRRARARSPSPTRSSSTGRPEVELTPWLSDVADDYSGLGARHRPHDQDMSASEFPSSSYGQRDSERENDPWQVSRNVM